MGPRPVRPLEGTTVARTVDLRKNARSVSKIIVGQSRFDLEKVEQTLNEGSSSTLVVKLDETLRSLETGLYDLNRQFRHLDQEVASFTVTPATPGKAEIIDAVGKHVDDKLLIVTGLRISAFATSGTELASVAGSQYCMRMDAGGSVWLMITSNRHS